MTEHETGSALDPGMSPDRWQRMVASITAAAAAELRRLRTDRTAVSLIVEWTRPLLATAAAVLVLSAAGLVWLAPSTSESTPAVAEVVAPTVVAEWLVVDQSPTTEQLLASMEGGTR